MKIIVVIEGGCLRHVFSENPDALDLTVIDYDARDENATTTGVPRADGTLQVADVWPAIAEPLPDHWKDGAESQGSLMAPSFWSAPDFDTPLDKPQGAGP